MATHQGQDPSPVQDPLCLYWRVKMKQTSFVDTQAVSAFKSNVLSISETIQSLLPDQWIKSFSEKMVKDDQIPLSGKLFKEFGVSSLLLFMAMMKAAPEQVSVHLSHDDGVEISNQIKLESKALSFFDTDLEAVRPVAEALGLLEKAFDLSVVASSQEDFYF